MKQSINRETRKLPDWMHDCTYIDDLKDGQTAYTLDAYVFETSSGWFISYDAITSPVNRGTHNFEVKREGDVILTRQQANKTYDLGYKMTEDDGIPTVYKPYSLEEKVDLLWNEKHNQ